MPARKTEKKKTAKSTPVTISAEQLRRKLKLKHIENSRKLYQAHPHVEKFFQKRGLNPGKIRQHSAKIIGTGILTGSLLLSPPPAVKSLPSPSNVVKRIKHRKINTKREGSRQARLVEVLKQILPRSTRPLERNEEKFLEQVLSEVIGIKARANLEGEHLNTTYGYIGAEQHLRRFPGDDLSLHGGKEDQKEGIAPGLGAWGYFAPAKDKLTPDLEETEKWYAVVQTLYLPDWNTRFRYLRDWYKYRKVLIVNINNGQAVVAAIADSGPAAWTGKHFGGSPEVMDYLGGPRYKKGPVILFFVDDPENKVPLGPVEYDHGKLQTNSLK